MGKLSRNLSVGLLDPRENLFVSGNLAAVAAEVITDCDGACTVSLDLRGTFSLTFTVEGTVDGGNWSPIVVRNSAGGVGNILFAGTAQGTWMGSCAGFRRVRVRCTAWTSGAASAVIMASNAIFDDFAKNGSMTSQLVTATGAAAAAVTLTLPAPGAGVRQYLTYLRIVRFAAAGLTAAAAPVLVTTTNIPGTLVFTFPAEAAAQGTQYDYQEDYAYPIVGTSQNTSMTIVCPAVTGVIWRVSAGYFIAP